VVEVHHTRVYEHARIGVAEVDLDLETRGHDHVAEILRAIGGAGYNVEEKRLERTNPPAGKVT
jgi:threonine dehydratase